jgi:endonuclease YncB( thermonuclease family)
MGGRFGRRFPRPRRGGGGLWSLVLAIAFAAVSSYWLKPSGRSVGGSAFVVDGDTLHVAGQTIRLKGIDAPEMKQSCTRGDKPYRCGETAKSALIGWIANKPVACRASGHDRYRRVLATCSVDGRDMGSWLVSEGLAVSYGGEYRREETQARLSGAGVWAGSFERPQDWRREHER